MGRKIHVKNELHRFFLFINHFEFGIDNECWEWYGYRHHKKGYGYFDWPEADINYAHVASYEFFVGSRYGKKVLHSCDNPPCVNPNHLWLGTTLANAHDMIRKGRANGNGGILTKKQVRKIRKLYFANIGYTHRKLGKKFKVSSSLIGRICNRVIWRHVL